LTERFKLSSANNNSADTGGACLLDSVRNPSDLKKIPLEDLQKLADDVRKETIDTVSVTGGHLGAGLGVVELTVALHYVFDTPKDKVIWDVSHQAYPHKILTNRRDRIRTLRQGGGLSGFCKRSESEYDAFGAGHSSTSISAALGFAVGRDLNNKKNHVVAVIGDGSITAGMAYEALNNAGASKSKLIVILNDNDMSISPAIGAMHNYLSLIVSSKEYRGLRSVAKEFAKLFPRKTTKMAKKAEKYAKGMIMGGTLFEELGFYYVGPIDGHNMEDLVSILENVRDDPGEGPVLIHVVTEKGKGYQPAESAPDKLHAVQPRFNIVKSIEELEAEAEKTQPDVMTYTQVFAQSLVKEAEKDSKILAITAAMASGTGLDLFEKHFPERFFDVGIAEQHAVTFAAGLACEGFKPFCAIYSSFMQRAYDQLQHDVVLQKLPVRFILDRAGLVGADGATHAGSFDLAFLSCLPGIIIMAPSDGAELYNMVSTACAIDDIPSAIRFPRGNATGFVLPESTGSIIEIGKGRIVKKGSGAAILNLGARLEECVKAIEMLKAKGVTPTLADMRFAKPLDYDLISELADSHEVLITIEEGSQGGFGAHVLHYLANKGVLDRGLKIRTMTLPDVYIEHNTQYLQYEKAGLNAKHIAANILQALGAGEMRSCL